MTTTSLYPEHEKLIAVKAQSQSIGEFLDWLAGKRIELCQWRTARDENPALEVLLLIGGCDRTDPAMVEQLMPINRRVEDVLAEFFGIDPDKLEAEKREMLRRLREK